MTSIVVIDDERTFKSDEDIIYLRNSKDAIHYLVEIWVSCYKPITQLFLDHDLGGTDDVMIVVDFLNMIGKGDYPIQIGSILVHSQNPSAADKIVRTLAPSYNIARIALPKLI